MQWAWVQSLAREDPTYHRAAKPVCHGDRAHMLYLLEPTHLEPMLHNKRSHHNEKPSHPSYSGPSSPQLEKACM